MLKIITKWFIQKAWPVIRKLLVKYGQEILEYILSKVKDLIMSWIEGMGKEKQEKAEESYYKAQATSDPEEKKKYEYEAEFYKKEAQSYADKLKEWEIKFEELKKQTEKEIKIKTQKLKAENLFETNSKSAMDSILLKQNNSILMLDDKTNNK
ncbi:hypothetical protein BIV60_14085 [Bacillus sp. MUM 116]|uniref:hypothetical protein n=1 Tax=Bacillus sp. MUM 116 TaxID=1678002 RepID=UPI0008F577AC|nr:hypothetical protein [Bacillus sp. MUM 116]OIK13404.1 hypothetical protein BIV60_14085 [Bacillus sp. MUM 116]